MIDGGADLYFEYGFVRAIDVSYIKQEKVRIDIQLYEMTDAGAAYGIFSQSRSLSDSIQDMDPMLVTGSNFAMFYKGQYFGVLSESNIDDSSSAALPVLIKHISSKIKEHDQQPELIRQSLDAGYSYNQIKYIRGKIALSASYFFSHKDIFNLKEAVCLTTDSIMLIIFHYGTGTEVVDRFEFLKQEFALSTRITEYSSENSHIRFTDRKGRNILITPYNNYILASIGSGSPAMIPEWFHNAF